ncbi:hypothetical protein [Paraburkholderia domus]|uniref:hypothetical protein n=1 Tax=Paraburkholderia domus TaxID=2793075 RepID=UPI0019123403|nr:hypothetical protein [Paraburkholderia domus]MBK5061800.1 hypothetical protein [Burkholderia sp. R-70199]CAE6900760.1 hypothetical protein R70199_03680 [Paraburkholderia domus]
MTTKPHNPGSFEMEIVKQPNGIYVIADKPVQQPNLNLAAAVVQTVHQKRRAERKEPAVTFKSPLPARLDGDAHARIDAAMAKRTRKAAKLKGKAEAGEAK